MHKSKNPFGLKEDNPSQSNCQNHVSHPSLSHIKQKCQWQFDSSKDEQIMSKGLKYP